MFFEKVAFLLTLVLFAVGCGSSAAPISNANFDPVSGAQTALTTYDTNGDKKLDAKELEQCPALKSVLKNLDSNKDKSLNAEEIAERLRVYEGTSENVYSLMFIMQRGQPLKDAAVVLEPEPFMGGTCPTYNGRTDSFGSVFFEGVKPADGLHPGFYKLRVTPQGGAEVIKGCEIADDVPSIGRMEIHL